MKYYSTSGNNELIGLEEAVMRSLSPDGGVYMPETIPYIPKALFNNISEMSLTDISYVVGTQLFRSIEPEVINDIVKDVMAFPIPLVKISDRCYSLELFHGPTGSFKDVGTRFMARILTHFRSSGSKDPRPVNVLVATSGDTGAAVADAFGGIDGVSVHILYSKVHNSNRNLGFMQSHESNIHPVEVRGTFDECQNMVRAAILDRDLSRSMRLTSANSLNIARLLPQTFYYFHAYARLVEYGENPHGMVISTPCGNLGNLTAALLSKQMGLPIAGMLAAGSAGERLWGDIRGDIFSTTPNEVTLSTNLSRIHHIVEQNPELKSIIGCHTYSNNDIDSQIYDTYNKSGYLMGRNSAMACRALGEIPSGSGVGVFLSTSNPSGYAAHLNELLGDNVIDEPDVRRHHKPDRNRHVIAPTYQALRKYLLDNSN